MIIIIPSIREINLKYLRPLLNKGNKIIVVDDTDEERITANAREIIVLHYSDRKRLLGDLETCIPQKNGVCRDLGLLVAYHIADDNETVVCLDDDCEVFSNYQRKAENSLDVKTLPIVKTKNKFYNPLDIYKNLEETIYPRGFPYERRDDVKDYDYGNKKTGRVVFNLGLWRGVFDINAVDKLYLNKFSYKNASLKYSQVIVDTGPYISLCSMNMIMKRELIPAIYQLPMNEPIIDNWKIDRYGDIWGGYICKKLIDKKGDYLTIGDPLIFHHKDSSLHKNIRQEHYAHIVNLLFCDLLDKASKGIKKDSYLNMYKQLVNNLKKLRNKYPESLKNYLIPTVRKMDLWTKALEMNSSSISKYVLNK